MKEWLKPLFHACGVNFLGNKRPSTAEVAGKIGEPVAQALGLQIWDVRFEKEGSEWYLRYFIDKEGGVRIDDCEAFSRQVDKLLDDADPIEQSYFLEVSSPGVERELKKDWHFQKYIGHKVDIRLIRATQPKKTRDYTGVLAAYAEGQITLTAADGEYSFDKTQTAYVRLHDDFDYGGQNP